MKEERVDRGTGGADAVVRLRSVPEEGSGVTETLLGDTFSTRWFDCAAEEAESRESYEAIQPPVGTSWWWWSWS